VDASCPKCHAALAPGMRTCQFCGTSLEGIVPAAAPDPPPGLPPGLQPGLPPGLQDEPQLAEATPPAADAALAPDALASPQVQGKSGRWPRKRILSIALRAAFPLLGIALIFVLILSLRTTFPIFGDGNQGSAGQPANSAPAQASGTAAPSTAAAGLGVDIYPGATPLSDASQSSRMDKTILSQTFSSSDTSAQVVEFYKARMVGYSSIYASGDAVVVSLSPTAQDSVLVAISPTPGGKTKFSITRTSSPN